MNERVEVVRRGLREAADPTRAPGMQAYMKSSMPFLGVASGPVRLVARDAVTAVPFTDRADWEGSVRTLYDEASYREERYAALRIAAHPKARPFRDADELPLWRHLIVTGAWWDLVDTTADLAGGTLLRDPDAVTPIMRAWATDDDLWLRRVAIISQLKARDATDLDLLTFAIERNVEGTRYGSEFFIRKAIGWALRQHARTNPAWVSSFVDAHAGVLSGLSRREALRHVT